MSSPKLFRRILSAFVLTMALSALPLLAHAAEPGPDEDDPYSSAEADALFKEGVAGMLKSDFEKACPLIGRSLKLDPRLGTLYTLAECEIQRGRIATGTAHLRSFIDQVNALPDSKQGRYEARKVKAEKRYAEVFPQVPKVILSLPPEAPWTTQITLDGEPLDLRNLTEPHPVDPGSHVLTTRAGGKLSEVQISCEKGESKSLRLPLDLPVRPCDPSSCAPPPVRAQGGCAACSVGRAEAGEESWALLAFVGAGALAMRRRARASCALDT